MNVPPARAIAIAAILDAHPKRLPHWHDWAVEMRAEAAQEMAAEAPASELEQVVREFAAVGAQPVATPVVDLVAALRASVEAAKARRRAQR